MATLHYGSKAPFAETPHPKKSAQYSMYTTKLMSM
jgi:hypothetical protein